MLLIQSAKIPGSSPLACRRLPVRLVLAEVLSTKDVREVVHRSVTRAQRWNYETTLDRRQDRSRVVLRVVDEVVAPQERGDDEGWDARPGAPLIIDTRRAALAAAARGPIGRRTRRR